jgi:hypothetical protein
MIINNTVPLIKNSLYFTNKNETAKVQSKTYKTGYEWQKAYSLSNVYYMPVNFTSARSSVIKDITHTAIYNKYFLPALQKKPKLGLFEFIKEFPLTQSSAEEVKEFLFGITQDEVLSKSFIEEINKNPRRADGNVAILLDKLGSADSFKEWYYHEKGYQRAYERYF